jgi:nucleoside-diphosphate-sugar epimerase
MSNKTIFLAGASGAIGRVLAPMLIADGWRVVGTTRSAEKAHVLETMGVEPAILDIFDADAVLRAVRRAEPHVVIHQLTDLPAGLDPAKMTAALVRNARIRDEGTRNLMAATQASGASRVIAQSISFLYARRDEPATEDDPLIGESDPAMAGTVRGVNSLERQVLDAPLEGIVLRYGMLYGPGTGFDKGAGPGSVHVDAAAKAAALAVTLGAKGIYNVAETDGAVSSAKAIAALGWDAGWRVTA